MHSDLKSDKRAPKSNKMNRFLNHVVGFAGHTFLPTLHFTPVLAQPRAPCTLAGAFRISHRSTLRMCAPGQDSGVEGPMQGPSQAPTKAGVSTAGLSQSDAAFIEACYLPDVEKIEEMLADGLDPSIVDINGRTALHFCAGNGLPTICRKLLDAGADINKQDVMGLTPLHMAAGYKKVDTVRFLIQENADANIASFQGQLPVELAESMLEKTPQKRFLVPNADYAKLRELVQVLDEATEEEDDEDFEMNDEDAEVNDAVSEITETDSAKFVVRVKAKGEAPPVSPVVKVDDVKVTIRVKEPSPDN